MRKHLLGVLSLALVLSGCSQAHVMIQNSSDEIMTIGSQTYTKEDEFNFQKKSNGPSGTIQLALRTIYEKEVGMNDDILAEAKKQVQESIDSVDDFETQIKNVGYKDIEDYTNKVAVSGVQAEHLLKKYLKDDKKAVKEKLEPSMAGIFEFDSEDNAKKALDALKNGKDAAEVKEQFSTEEATYVGTTQFVSTQNTDLPIRMVNSLSVAKKAGALDEVFFNESQEAPVYYVAVLDSNDYDKNIDAYAAALKEDQAFNEDCLVYYLDKYEFEVHDQDIFNYFKANNPRYLVTRPDLSENK